MVSHSADVARQNFLVPLDPFIVIDVTFFALAELATMNNSAAMTFFHRNHYVQAFMINNTRNCI